MKKTYSKDWCKGFCRTCGTSCADHSEEIIDLKRQIANLEVRAVHTCHEFCQRRECVQERTITELTRQIEILHNFVDEVAQSSMGYKYIDSLKDLLQRTLKVAKP